MKKKSDLISVIIAVCNIEAEIPECLESVAKQTYKNFETIVIDDGSTDGSLAVCRKFRLEHPALKMRVIHTKNYGLPHARNRGLQSARGKFVCLIDGDDALEPEYLEELHKAAALNDADIAVCGYRPVRNIFMEEKFVKSSQLPLRATVSGTAATEMFLTGQKNLDVVTWNKMYRRSLFLKNGIRFPDGEIFEDKLTTYKLYFASERVSYIDQVLYNYRQREGSIMNNSDMTARLRGRMKAAQAARKYLAKTAGRKHATVAAAEVSVALAHIAYLDNAASGRVAAGNFKKHYAWLMKNREKILKNPFTTRKMRYYLLMMRPFHGAVYKTFRKIVHE